MRYVIHRCVSVNEVLAEKVRTRRRYSKFECGAAVLGALLIIQFFPMGAEGRRFGLAFIPPGN